MKTLIAEVKRNALDDGPGIRSVVFFKGCPLNCVWCQNPETKSPGQELAYHAERCQGCGKCREACPAGAFNFSIGVYPVDRGRCTLCGACVQACLEGALVFAGREYTVDDLVKVLARDAVFYRNTGGGVTLSGGEPTLHAAYLGHLLPRLKDLGIPVCLETCGHYDRRTFERSVLPYLDLIYFDLKLADPDRHARFCGRDNRTIRANFEALAAQGKVALLPRIPLVPGITDTAENLKGLRDYLSGLSLARVAFLPYNPLWLSKLGPLGLTADYTHAAWMGAAEKDHIRSMFHGFEVNPF
jgi:pyruvate formate lyase activating enzyme